MLNGIFVFLIAFSILLAAGTGHMPQLTAAILDDSRTSVEIALRLIGVMAFFLGLMKVAEHSGLLRILCRASAPVMRRLFPGVPPDHPAMSAMLLNIGSNVLGLGNAATPFGIRAIRELDTLNADKGTATNAMVLFLAINTAGFAILPSTAIALRAAAGSADATGIFLPTWLASGSATLVGVVTAIALSRLPRYRRTEPGLATGAGAGERTGEDGAVEPPVVPAVAWRRGALWVFWAAFVILLARYVVRSSGLARFDLAKGVLSHWILPAIVAALVLFGWTRKIAVYASFVQGAREGFRIAVRIIPFLVAILVAVGMFRASGGMDLLQRLVGPWTAWVGMPAEALPMAVLRPLSGSGALGYMVEVMKAHGADSLVGYMVSTYQGSTETTFYVLAVYFGAAGVTRTRHALPACLAADAAGILVATIAVNALFG